MTLMRRVPIQQAKPIAPGAPVPLPAMLATRCWDCLAEVSVNALGEYLCACGAGWSSRLGRIERTVNGEDAGHGPVNA